MCFSRSAVTSAPRPHSPPLTCSTGAGDPFFARPPVPSLLVFSPVCCCSVCLFADLCSRLTSKHQGTRPFPTISWLGSSRLLALHPAACRCLPAWPQSRSLPHTSAGCLTASPIDASQRVPPADQLVTTCSSRPPRTQFMVTSAFPFVRPQTPESSLIPHTQFIDKSHQLCLQPNARVWPLPVSVGHQPGLCPHHAAAS